MFAVLEVGMKSKAPRSLQEQITCKTHGREFIPNLLNTCDPNAFQFIIDRKFKSLEKKVLCDSYLGINTKKGGRAINLFTLRAWHKYVFNGIYDWAGKYRTVDLPDCPYACRPDFIYKCMLELKLKLLDVYTPCKIRNPNELANVLSDVYAEFIARHPFRDGNARLAKLLIKVMAYQAGYKSAKFSSFNRNGKVEKALVNYALHTCSRPLTDKIRGILLNEFNRYCRDNDVVSMHQQNHFSR